MAAFFPRTIYNTEASLVPLFRLLDDFESSSSRHCGRASNAQCKKQQYYRKPAVSHWKPRFDVRETAETYELHGELPGLNKSDVSIEFTEPQTLVVCGKVDRTYTAGTSPYGTPASEEVTQQQQTPADESASSNSHQATVADEDDASIQEENGFEVVSEASNTAPATPETETATIANPTASADTSKYWLSERSIGQFARSFSFPARVDQDTVKASFQDGILSITVPKAKKHETIRISIN